MANESKSRVRYKKGKVSATNTSVAQLRNPTVVMWWAAAIPGYGHVMLSKYVKGFLLIFWEFIVNVNSKLNTAIMYTFTGRFDQAVDVLNKQWILLYVPVYLYSIWDSRRTTIDLNKYAILADMSWSASEIDPITFSALENNYLDKRKNWLAIFWSLITPGLGHLYVNRLPSGFYILVWFMVTLYFSNTLPAIHYTFQGDFQAATEVVNVQWIVFIPSMYCFAPYDAYLQCDSYNKLMAKQQSFYLMNKYQDKTFKQKTSLFSKSLDAMNVVATFDHLRNLERAKLELERRGISKENIVTIPLTEKKRSKKSRDIIRGSGYSLLDVTFAFGIILSLFGVVYGFVLPGGPVTWGLVGVFTGWCIGFLVDLFVIKRRLRRKEKVGEDGETMVVIHCSKEKVTFVKEILFNHYTVGLNVIEEEYKDGVY